MMAMLCYTFLRFVGKDKDDQFGWGYFIMIELLLEAMVVPIIIGMVNDVH